MKVPVTGLDAVRLKTRATPGGRDSTRAVNPNSVVGATRRIAELLVEGSAGAAGPIACGVRLSSVLGRPGSIVPRFIDQIRAGGPVLVADPDVRRYFMLGSEAAHLVLHAATHAEAGTLYVFDLGEQIRLLDLARDLIKIEGLVPEDEITIQFTGLRPGERLYEELASAAETVTGGKVERVLRIRSNDTVDQPRLRQGLTALAAAAASADTDRILHALGAFVPELQADSPLPETAEIDREEPTSGASVQFGDSHSPGQQCPRCAANSAHRSRTRSAHERLRKNLTAQRLFRCVDCGWRGWMLPLDRSGLTPTLAADAHLDLAALDEALAAPADEVASAGFGNVD